MRPLYWNIKDTPKEIRAALEALSDEYSLRPSKVMDKAIRFEPIDAKDRRSRIAVENGKVLVRYSDTASALRAVGHLLSSGDPGEFSAATHFTKLGVMIDCSRNAVLKISHLKSMFNKLALLGYNQVLLYTEETYKLDGEQFFGYMRGAYTKQELIELDNHAHKLGIELVACIQTLGHLEQLLRWSAYSDIRDTSGVLFIGKDETYKLIEKMIKHFSQVFRSRRIHIGMDEAHDMGRGRYLDLCGYKSAFELFNEHLDRVVGICGKHGLKPMIWSDMYFRIGSKNNDYYDKESVIPKKVVSKIPRSADLVYWDYYHVTEDFYLNMIKKHREMGFNPIMGSGIWTWLQFWYDSKVTERTAKPCIEACKKGGVDEIFFTMWADDGAYCNYDSALPGLAWAADEIYGTSACNSAAISRLKHICGMDYETTRIIDQNLNMVSEKDYSQLDPLDGVLLACSVLWDDPLLGILWANMKAKSKTYWDKVLLHYTELQHTLENRSNHFHINDVVFTLIKVLRLKIEISLLVDSGYKTGDKRKLNQVLRLIPEMTALLKKFDKLFTEQWLKQNKPFGIEVLQIRYAGLIRRYAELSDRIRSFLSAKSTRIEEFENTRIDHVKGCVYFRYSQLAVSAKIFG